MLFTSVSFMGAYFTDSGGKEPQINMGLGFPPWSLCSPVSLKSDTYARITLKFFTWLMVCL